MSGYAGPITCPHCRRTIAPVAVRIHLALLELGPLSLDQLEDMMATPRRHVSVTLDVLKGRGLVERVRRGVWRAARDLTPEERMRADLREDVAELATRRRET